MIENFSESPKEFRDYDSQLLLKILNKTSVEKKKIDDSLISINYRNAKNEELKILESLEISLKKKKINSRVNDSLFYEFSLLTEGKIDALVFYDSSENIKEIFSFIIKETGGFFIEQLCNKKNLHLASNKYIGKIIKEMIEK